MADPLRGSGTPGPPRPARPAASRFRESTRRLSSGARRPRGGAAGAQRHPRAASPRPTGGGPGRPRVLLRGIGNVDRHLMREICNPGLATATCLREQGVSCVILEKVDCLVSLWQQRTYNRLKLHLPKQFCELPLMPFPDWFPTYPTKEQFIEYIESYAMEFKLQPRFNQRVESASYDQTCGHWRVRTVNTAACDNMNKNIDYISRWLVVASGENAEPIIPDIAGVQSFRGSVIHASRYRTGADYEGKKVLVVSCGNSGMELCLDLFNHNAKPFMVVRNTVHVLPREMFGRSTFDVGMALMKRLLLWMVDRFLLSVAYFKFGNTEYYGLKRPALGPMELKDKTGKTPVLDVGTLAQIKNGNIKVLPTIRCLTPCGAKFLDGQKLEFDSVILCTGYRSNVPNWLKDSNFLHCKIGTRSSIFSRGEV